MILTLADQSIKLLIASCFIQLHIYITSAKHFPTYLTEISPQPTSPVLPLPSDYHQPSRAKSYTFRMPQGNVYDWESQKSQIWVHFMNNQTAKDIVQYLLTINNFSKNGRGPTYNFYL